MKKVSKTTHKNLVKLTEFMKATMKPPEKIGVMDWSEKYLELPSDTAISGKYSSDITPFWRGIWHYLTDDDTRQIVIASSAQIGKTLSIMAYMAYIIGEDASPMLMVFPSITDATKMMKLKILPFVKQNKKIKNKIYTKKGTSSQRILMYEGGSLYVAGSNVPADLAALSIRIVLADEVDRWTMSAGEEGDPFELAKKRTTTFSTRSKILVTSTPTNQGKSKIWQLYESADMQKYFVPCPHCDHRQVLEFSGLVWDKDEKGNHLPDTTKYKCINCNELIDYSNLYNMNLKGEWRSTAEFILDNSTKSFHLNALYSPFISWTQIVKEFLKAKEDQALLKVFVNTVLGEPWQVRSDTPDWSVLYNRKENYKIKEINERVVHLTAGIDAQGDRFSVSVWGWAEGLEAWLIDRYTVQGNTAEPETQQRLYTALKTEYDHPLFKKIKIKKACIDTGYNTASLMAFVTNLHDSMLIAIKGRDSDTLVMPPKAYNVLSNGQKSKVGKQWQIGSSAGKSELYQKLQIVRKDEHTPGYLHFPDIDEEYFKELTAEALIAERDKRGFTVYRWTNLRSNKRNEALDEYVYARASAEMLGLSRYIDDDWKKDRTSQQDDNKGPNNNPPPTPISNPNHNSVWGNSGSVWDD